MDDAQSILALWRESGEWWSFEPYREFCRYIDEEGIRRETSTEVACASPADEPATPYDESNRDDPHVRMAKEGRGRGPGRGVQSLFDPSASPMNEASDGGGGCNRRYNRGFRQSPPGADRPDPNLRSPGFVQDHPSSPSLEMGGLCDASLASAQSLRSVALSHRNGPSHVPSEPDCPVAELPSCPSDPPNPKPQTPDPNFRIRKTRDEKVAAACGYVKLIPEIHAKQAANPYAPLHVLSGYAFGRSSMLAEEIPVLAAERGLPAAAVADPFSLAGAVEFVRSARKAGVKPLVGASFELEDGGEIVLLAKDKTGYRSLSRLITECHLSEPRLFPLCTWERLARHSQGVLCLTGGHRGPLDLLLAGRHRAEAAEKLQRLIDLYQKQNVFAEIERSFVPWEIAVESALLELAERAGVTLVAGGATTHAKQEHFPAQDVLVCIETLCTVDEIVGRKPQRHPDQPQITPIPERALNSEHFLRSPDEMAELFADRPDLLANTLRLADLCEDDVLPPRTQLPRLYEGDDAQVLQDVVYHGALRYHGKIPPGLKKRLDHELKRIIKLDFARHFLVAWDVCRWSKENDILLSGRGSVVDSAVAYCLGISRIDAYAHKLHFDRFLPDDGSKRPDIDIDFEAKRRDDVRNYMAAKYGEDKVATVAAFGAYCTRGIVRGVGKVFGIPDETLGYLSKRIHGGVQADQLEAALEKRPELRNSDIPKERFQWVFRLVKQLMDIPTNTRAHSSGVVVSSEPLADTVPVIHSGVDGVPIIQWDKRSAKFYFDKFDILCLRGQDVLSGTQRFARQNNPAFDAEEVPIDDPETFRTMRSGQLIGIPQSASPAMRQAHVRLRTENLHDASLVQAGIRPGVGGAVKLNELIMRRRGIHSYSFEHPLLEKILGFTYGIIVFQEQVDQLLQAFCGYTSGEAEDIRDAIHKKRREDFAKQIREEVHGRVLERGFGINIAQQVYEYVAGFQGYGFAQGHALAFAEISIRSIWCQQNMPAEYFAALMNAQPAGYYGPCTLANEARVRGVAVLPPDVNISEIGFTVEDVQSDMDPRIVVPRGGMRTGLMQIRTLSQNTRERIVQERLYGLYDSIFDFCARVHPNRDELESLILCGAFDRVNDNRRTLLWAVPQAVSWGCAAEMGGRASSRAAQTIQPRSLHLPRCGGLDATSSVGPPCLSGAPVPPPTRNEPKPAPTPTLPFTLPEPELLEGIEDFTPQEKAVYERHLLGMDIRNHLMAFERTRVAAKGGLTAAEVVARPNGTKAFVVGNPLRLRFPPTRTGKRVVFFDLEDESGLLNVTCFDEVYQRYGHALICHPYITVLGEVQDRDGHMAFLGHHIFPYKPNLNASTVRDGQAPVKSADFLVG